VPDARAYQTLEFLRTTFLISLSDLSRDDQRRVIRALEQLDIDERLPSLRVHQLQGSRDGLWSASASRSLRITFERLEGRRKLLLQCSQHYGD
jgi:mRNA-degrading endonuclease YafQ of YafQ-DinJ toxin-antitoxin module